MSTKKWILAIAIALAGILVWWYALQDVAGPMQENAAPTLVMQTTPVSQESNPSPPAPLPVVQSRTATVVLPAPKNIDEYVDWQRDLVAGLIVMDDADSIMAAALILHALYAADTRQRHLIHRLLARAFALAPGDRAIASVVLRVCRSIQECDGARYEAAVRNIDSRNVLGPMPELVGKIEKGAPPQVTEALEALAKLRLNLYNAELISRVARVISSAPTSPRFAPATSDLLRLQSELALRAVEADEVPSYLAIGPACQQGNWRNTFSCELIVRDLSRSELIELQRLAMEIVAARADNRTKRPADIVDAENYFNWLGYMKARNPPPAEQWIALLAQQRTELAASRAWLERNGVALREVPRWLERAR